MYRKYILWILTAVWMVVIFALSSQTGKQSSELSYEVSNTIFDSSEKVKSGVKAVVKPTNSITVKHTETVSKPVNSKKKYILRRKFNNQVRSAAHSINYFVLAILLFFALKQHGLSNWKVVLLTLLICVLYSVSDEWHQGFVPGRGCELSDGIFDLIGSVIGVLLSLILSRVVVKKK